MQRGALADMKEPPPDTATPQCCAAKSFVFHMVTTSFRSSDLDLFQPSSQVETPQLNLGFVNIGKLIRLALLKQLATQILQYPLPILHSTKAPYMEVPVIEKICR